MKKKIYMRVVDYLHEDTEANFYNDYHIRLLSEKYNIIYSKNPDFIIYGLCGANHLKYDCVRIFSHGENVRADYNIADYAIDFDYLDYGDRHLRMPLFHHDFRNREVKEKTKFASFMVSNSVDSSICPRNTFFEILSKYKKVDSGGRYANNIGFNVANKIEWLKDYKFNICFENSSYPGYLTEKLFDAYMAGCVPIYWGDTTLRIGVDSNIESKNIDSNFTESNFIESSTDTGGSCQSNRHGGGGG